MNNIIKNKARVGKKKRDMKPIDGISTRQLSLFPSVVVVFSKKSVNFVF